MPLVLKRNPEETWLEAARRAGEPFGLAQQVESNYWLHHGEGTAEPIAALRAVLDEDVAEFVPEGWVGPTEATGVEVAHE
jgi:hypothetical protein